MQLAKYDQIWFQKLTNEILHLVQTNVEVVRIRSRNTVKYPPRIETVIRKRRRIADCTQAGQNRIQQGIRTNPAYKVIYKEEIRQIEKFGI